MPNYFGNYWKAPSLQAEIFCFWFCSIFGDIGEYDPTETTKEYEKKAKQKEKERERDKKKSRNSSSYFDKTAGVDDEVSTTGKNMYKQDMKLHLVQLVLCFPFWQLTLDIIYFF